MTPREYIDSLANHTKGIPPFVSGVCGRIIRGKTPEDFERLSDDPNRKVVMLTDASGLAKMFGKSDYQKLGVIGYNPDYTNQLLVKGTTFKLVVFPETSAILADWDGVFRVAQQVYPALAGAIRQHGSSLRGSGALQFVNGRTKDFADIEAKCGRKFMDCDDSAHPHFMNYDAWEKSAQDDVCLRALLYHTFYLRELFAGNGFTYNEVGKKGVNEYLMPNCPISDIPGHVVLDLNVTKP